ncbi:hypothetical protein [Streptomyces sp. NPDC048527]|uniref:hypothetical protein n=1 Tax=Streptomyces sp. NPDC048527 TaxID=3365568 RepID=UPI0037214A9D
MPSRTRSPCAGTNQGSGLYADAGSEYVLTSVSVDSFPLSITCHWTGGYSTEAVWFWVPLLMYVGLVCAVACSALLLVGRTRRLRSPQDGSVQ